MINTRQTPANEDLRVFTVVARRASFAGAAAELGVSPAYVSKRLRVLEQVLGTQLLHRSTRRVTVTEDGERVYQWALTILDDIDHLMQAVSLTRSVPRGSLRICSSFGFGRQVLASAISQLQQRYPALQVRLELFDRLVDVASEGFDLDIRVGDEIAPHLIARRLADNHRILCAAPNYLAARGTPRSFTELAQHDCLVIKERDQPFGVWQLRRGQEQHSVKVTGPLSTNHGEIALQWALDGRGILLRSIWNVAPLLASGQLLRVLPDYALEANVWAVYPSRLGNSAKVRVAVEFLQEYLQEYLQALLGGPLA